jgi:hypothetical protein
MRHPRLARVLAQTITLTRPSPGLGSLLRPIRAQVSVCCSDSPKPWPRAKSTPRPSPGLGSGHLFPGFLRTISTSRMGRQSTPSPMMQQGIVPTMLPAPSPITPYLHYCVYDQSRGRWEMSNPDTAAMRKYCYPVTQVRTRGLRKDGHASKQDLARGK